MCTMAVEEKHPRDQIEGSYVNLKGWRIGSIVQIWSRWLRQLRNNMHDSDAESIILQDFFFFILPFLKRLTGLQFDNSAGCCYSNLFILLTLVQFRISRINLHLLQCDFGGVLDGKKRHFYLKKTGQTTQAEKFLLALVGLSFFSIKNSPKNMKK